MVYEKVSQIPGEKELIIFDFYDSLVYGDNKRGAKLREGARELIRALKREGKDIAISSDGRESKIELFIEELSIRSLFDGVYGKNHVFFFGGG